MTGEELPSRRPGRDECTAGHDGNRPQFGTRSRAAVRGPVQRGTRWRVRQAVLGRPRGGSAGV